MSPLATLALSAILLFSSLTEPECLAMTFLSAPPSLALPYAPAALPAPPIAAPRAAPFAP